MLGLYALAYVIKILDTIVFRFDELVGEAIVTKAFGLLLVLLYVWGCGRSPRDIGFHSRGLGRSLLMGYSVGAQSAAVKRGPLRAGCSRLR